MKKHFVNWFNTLRDARPIPLAIAILMPLALSVQPYLWLREHTTVGDGGDHPSGSWDIHILFALLAGAVVSLIIMLVILGILKLTIKIFEWCARREARRTALAEENAGETDGTITLS